MSLRSELGEARKAARHSMLSLAVLLVLGTAACATGAPAPSPEEEVAARVQSWADALEAHNVDEVMTFYSDSFEHYEYGTKSGYREYLQSVVDEGLFEDLEVFAEDMEIDVDGTQATVYPIDLQAAFGGAVIELIWEEEAAGVWRITAMDVQLF